MPDLKSVVVPEYGVSEEVHLDPGTSAVLVIDMQNDFVDPRGRLFVPSAPATVPAIRSLLERARASGVPVIYTQDWRPPGNPKIIYKDSPGFPRVGEHTIAGTWGSEIIGDLAPGPHDLIVKKPTIDAFYGTPLDHYLRLLRIDTVVVTGTVANVCVLHAVSGASVRGYNVVYPVDAVSARSDFDAELAVHQAYFVHQAIVTHAEDISFDRARD
jgi:nicotinamidase-related amidase